MDDIKERVDATLKHKDVAANLDESNADWRERIKDQIGAYMINNAYLVKPYNEICYLYMGAEEARDQIKANVSYVLRTKYFDKYSSADKIVNRKMNDDIDEKVKAITKSFIEDLTNNLIRAEIDDPSSEFFPLKRLPDCCLAFKNGVYNFEKDDWEFMYEYLEKRNSDGLLQDKMYCYNKNYIIDWYLNFNFDGRTKKLYDDIVTGLGGKFSDITIEDAYKVFKKIVFPNQREPKNYNDPNYKDSLKDYHESLCFGVMHNMAHDKGLVFSMTKFIHLCEIMGYTLKNKFMQKFIYLIGSGSNGKDSLFSGVYGAYLPELNRMSIGLQELEGNFSAGDLVNKHANIYLESSTTNKAIAEVKTIKALTGSELQSVEQKNVKRFNARINCRYVFSANNMDDLIFNDTSNGFERRINMFEAFYIWDPNDNYLIRGDKDWYQTNFSGDNHEFKERDTNILTYVIFGMLGLNNINKKNKGNFSSNDWRKDRFTNINITLEDKLKNIPLSKLKQVFQTYKNVKDFADMHTMDGTPEHRNLSATRKSFISESLEEFNLSGLPDAFSRIVLDDEMCTSYFAQNDIRLPLEVLKYLIDEHDMDTKTLAKEIKKIYTGIDFEESTKENKHVKCVKMRREDGMLVITK